MIYVKQDLADGQSQFDHFKAKPMQFSEDGTALAEVANQEEKNTELEQQLRCIRLSPDCKQLACGDWTGNIRIHDLATFEESLCI